MSKSTEFLDKILKISPLKSDRQIALALGKTPQYISNIRNKPVQLGDYAIFKLAQIAKIDPVPELAKIQSEKAKNDEEIAFWQSKIAS